MCFMAYLVCDKCGEYYELQPGESPDDFSDKCECGGDLRYVQDLNDIDKLQKVCPNCGSIIEDNDEICPICGFRLKKPHVTEKRLIFGVLWDVFSISVLMVGAILFAYIMGIIIIPSFLNPQLRADFYSNFYSDLGILIMISLLTICLVVGVIARIGPTRDRYLEFYRKMNWNL